MKGKIWCIVALFCMLLFCCPACKEERLLWEGTQEDGLSEESNAEDTVPEAEDLQETGTIYVHVCGAVVCPGVYELPVGSRLHDAVNKAGGFDEEADREAENLVRELVDGEKARIPFIGETVVVSEEAKIDINTADLKLLCEIPGIGESRAQAIVDYRKEHGGFQSAKELMNVPGIKEGIYAKMSPYIECGQIQ